MNSLEKYKKLTEEDKNYLNDYQYYESIYYFNKGASDEDVLFVKRICERSYLVDEEGYSITKITDFVADNYFNKNLTKEELNKSSKWDILEAIAQNNYQLLKDKDNSYEL
ncbi:MAG: hypothetical protein RSD09_05880 [Bacilli bacterium]